RTCSSGRPNCSPSTRTTRRFRSAGTGTGRTWAWTRGGPRPPGSPWATAPRPTAACAPYPGRGARRIVRRGEGRAAGGARARVGASPRTAGAFLPGWGPTGRGERGVGFGVLFAPPGARPRGRPPAVLARGRDDCHHFDLADPPTERCAEQALAGMKASAAGHLEAILLNLKHQAR